MEILKSLLRNLADKLGELLGNAQLQEVPVRVDTRNHPATYKTTRHPCTNG